MPGWLDWVGYLGSLVVLVSLLMSSIKKLRWINLVGAMLFAFYGFMIASIPTGFMNVGIVIIDVYYLVKIYSSKDYFRVLPVETGYGYLKNFMSFYKDDMKNFIEVKEEEIYNAKVQLYVLRNMTPASIFIADEIDNETLEIKVDYAIPQYRDFKIGKFVYEKENQVFKDMNYKKLVVKSENEAHIKYIKKMGFKEDQEKADTYFKKI